MTIPTTVESTPRTKTPFKVVPATVEDADAMADISGDAFWDDSHTLLQAVWKGKDWHREGSKEYLPSLFTNPRVDIRVARKGLEGEGEVIGFIMLAKRGYPNPDATPEEEAARAPEGEKLTIKELGATTNQAMNHYCDLLMPVGCQCRVIHGWNVAPAYQGQGVGSALMKWVTDIVDEDQVYCWVSSSMGAMQAYAKAGFVEVGRLELKLDDYAQGIKWKQEDGSEKEWGTYFWPYMRRDPK
ncbi:acyl-CoA N-acyltransferase [Linnemannia elongata AG-77]|uniref:Acyl-CoA N-acyltransferase n=1 Tax=Linnemannia elongata AG-77 TaxID=1314771 RepID=A0A197JGH5_9FUNG|nr:acyl-CoA N-acyltransferase [Linnemannia elongata AG-77]OAQ23606.1 acyl-CoA N-acyltransferase [Linnemannia elongata AG-77]